MSKDIKIGYYYTFIYVIIYEYIEFLYKTEYYMRNIFIVQFEL